MYSEILKSSKHKGKTRFCLAILICFLIMHLILPIGAEIAFAHGNREEKKIALTFDDGPHPYFTEKILDILEKYNVRATFFMIGENVKNYPTIARRVYEAGHEIGNHTYTHPHMKKISPDVLEQEIKKTEDALRELDIPRPALFRPPEGFRSAEQVARIEGLGYRVVVWSLDTHDWKNTASSLIEAQVLKTVQGGDVLLFHDYISGQNTTIAALKQIIPKLLESGYTFVTVSELLGQASASEA